ncbi:MAG: acylphosphatase [bacterium]|nr:acylphosphatase [bacterium]
MKVAAHIIVKGMVQGVGFRWFVDKHARNLGLTGYVKNLFSGDVEVMVEGERGLIEELIEKMKVGNRFSNVVDVKIKWKEFSGQYSRFQIQF